MNVMINHLLFCQVLGPQAVFVRFRSLEKPRAPSRQLFLQTGSALNLGQPTWPFELGAAAEPETVCFCMFLYIYIYIYIYLSLSLSLCHISVCVCLCVCLNVHLIHIYVTLQYMTVLQYLAVHYSALHCITFT